MRRKEVVVVVVAVAVAAVALVGALAIRRNRKKERQWRQSQRFLRKFARQCATPVPKLWEVADALVRDMEASLDESQGASTLNMLVSYVNSLPTGEERGLYYGLNLRGTDLLILCARLGGKDETISDLCREEISIPSNLLSANSQELFDYIAVEVGNFVLAHPAHRDDKQGVHEHKLGFTVSYPVDQEAATSGSAVKWKAFSANDTAGKAMVNGINQSLQKCGLQMRVFSMVNDDIGNLAGGRYYNKDAVAAISLTSGLNAAYIEAAQAVSKWDGPPPKSGEMAISTEWGSFNCSNLPITEFDADLDAESSNPGSRIFEKLISGKYLPEIVRRVLLKIAREIALFGDTVPPKLATPYLLSCPDMASIHQDTSEDREVVGEKLREIFGITDSTPMAREAVAEVCDIVVERGARLAGAGIVGIIKKLGRIEKKKSVVTVEGGLYEHYRVFRNYLHSTVWEMLGNDLSDNVIVEHCHGGSGAGAVFLAACQTQNPDS